MSRPRPIRFDVNTWLVMRGDPVLPKAIIERRKDRRGQDVYFVLSWDLDPGKHVLMGSKASLEDADSMVLYDVPQSGFIDGPPNKPRSR